MFSLFTMLLDLFRTWTLVISVVTSVALVLLVLVLAVRPPRTSTLPHIAIVPDASFRLGHVPSSNSSGWFAQLMGSTGLRVVQILVPGRTVLW